MQVIVVGAGIIGITTAWYLQRLGCQVTVIEQRGEAAMEASYANGAVFSAGLSAPWAAPGAIAMGMRSQFNNRGAFRWIPDGSLAQLRWIAASMRECQPERYAANRRRITALACYARDCLQTIEAAQAIDYNAGTDGILQLYRSPISEGMRQGLISYLSAMNIPFKMLKRDEVFALEPALAASAPQLSGALHLPHDSGGDCRTFSVELAKVVQRQQGRILWNTPVERIEQSQANNGTRRVQALVAGGQTLQADAYVFATGSFSAPLLRGLVDLPVYPLKGYSFSAPITQQSKAPRHSMFDFGHKIGIARLGDTVRVSGIVEVAGYNQRLTPGRCQQLDQHFEDVFPGAIAPGSAQYWSGLRPATPNGVPIIARAPLDNLFINTGHGGCGWSLSCGSAKLMADMVMGRPTDLNAADYALA
jgi:D-amino-acid dehydrogenase